MTLKKYKPYLISIAIPLAVGGVSAFFTMNAMPYYDMQKKPFFAPPNVVFPVVWTILYILMGISAAWIWNSKDPQKMHNIPLYFRETVLPQRARQPLLCANYSYSTSL